MDDPRKNPTPNQAASANATEAKDKPRATVPIPPELAEFGPLFELARQGNLMCLPRLRKILDERPDIAAHYGHLSTAVERSWLHLISRDNLLIIESVLRHLATMRAELKPQTKLEELITEHIGGAWLQLQHADMALSNAEDEAVKLRQFRLKQAESAARRFNAACKNLALVRRLLGGVEMHVTHEHKITAPPPAPQAAPGPAAGKEPGPAPAEAPTTPPLTIPATRHDVLFGTAPSPTMETCYV